MNEARRPRKPAGSDEPEVPPVQVRVDQAVGAITGGKLVGVEVLHAETVIIDAGHAAAPPEPGAPPYKGLDFYEVADAPLFFGREQLTAELVAFVREHAFLAVVGASGSGKSSVARAGLMAALQGKAARPLEGGVQPPLGSRDWRYIAVTPTAQPFEALARGLAGDGAEGVALWKALRADPLALRDQVPALAGPGGRLLLLVDQFEELFTLCKDEAERAAYVDALLAACGGPAFGVAASRCIVILTVRADFYDRCIGFRNLRAALETHHKPIGVMNRDELQRTIELPAQAGQWAFQQGLVEQILDDVGDQPGNLPLLSYALLETWKRRSGRIMTLAGYQAAGGVKKAISRTADRVFDDLAQQGLADMARRIFLSLVEPGEEGRATRRRERLRDLAPGEGESPAAKALLALSARDARLVTVDGETVQISHEALITAWPKLGEWLATYHDDLQLLEGIRGPAEAWRAAPAAEKDNLLAHRGGRLDAAMKLHDAGEYPLADPAPAYLAACVALRDRERETERKRQRDLFRLIAGAAAVALVLALLSGVFGIRSKNSASTAATRAAEAQAAATRETTALQAAQRASEQSGLASVPMPGALAFDGTRLWAASQYSNTIQAIDPTSVFVNAVIPVESQPSALLFAAGQLWVANASSNTIQVVDPSANKIMNSIPVGKPSTILLYDGAGRVWVGNRGDETIHMIDVDTHSVITLTPGIPVQALASDGTRLWVAAGGSVEQFDIATRKRETGIHIPANQVALTYDGKLLWVLFSESAGKCQLWPIDVARFKSVSPKSQNFFPCYPQGGLIATRGLLWTIDRNGDKMRAIDPATGLVSKPIAVGRGPTAITSDGATLWVANTGDDTVQKIKLPSALLFEAARANTSPIAPEFSNHRAFDGPREWRIGEDGLEAVNPATGKIAVSPIPIDDEFHAVALAVAGGWLWMWGYITFDGIRYSVTEDYVIPIDLASINELQEIGLDSSAIQLGGTPSAMTFDGTWLWIVEDGNPSIQAVDPVSTNIVATIQTDINPDDLVVEESRLWLRDAHSKMLQYLVLIR